jgi:hypothetical protein
MSATGREKARRRGADPAAATLVEPRPALNSYDVAEATEDAGQDQHGDAEARSFLCLIPVSPCLRVSVLILSRDLRPLRGPCESDYRRHPKTRRWTGEPCAFPHSSPLGLSTLRVFLRRRALVCCRQEGR